MVQNEDRRTCTGLGQVNPEACDSHIPLGNGDIALRCSECQLVSPADVSAI
jgi:hypothetical protein